MVILRSQNKITDFLVILVWASPFNLENSLFIKDTNETWVDLNVRKQNDVVNLIEGSILKSKNEKFWETYYKCDTEWDILYSTEPFTPLSQKTMEFLWKFKCVMTEKHC